MKRHWQYLKYVIRHKWFVFLACRVMGVPLWAAIIHDWDKFLPSMWLSYARAFYTPSGSHQYQPTIAFDYAWNDHQKRNKHHWQYWMITWDKGNTECLKMPDRHAREMIADWMGAGRALGKPDTAAWYLANRDNIKLHPETRQWVDNHFGVNDQNGNQITA